MILNVVWACAITKKKKSFLFISGHINKYFPFKKHVAIWKSNHVHMTTLLLEADSTGLFIKVFKGVF